MIRILIIIVLIFCISDYRISNELFIRYNSSNEFFLIKKIKTGRVDLYEKNALPCDQKFLFYLKIPCCDNLFRFILVIV